ncbi:MAG: hypothetical protein IJG84_11000 [Kiritimatiellae bacterium]|nr:hypothetical protein [Kiritimatiellia bacterium]
MKTIVISLLKFVGYGLAIIVSLFVLWLFLVVTPDQSSAEADYWREKIEAGGAK